MDLQESDNILPEVESNRRDGVIRRRSVQRCDALSVDERLRRRNAAVRVQYRFGVD